MDAFHIDRESSLICGQQPALYAPCLPEQRFQTFMTTNFPAGISRAGEVFLSDVPVNDIHTYNQRVKETEFESIRRLYFPEKPSRFQCFFALESLQDVQIWLRAFKDEKKEQPCTVWKVSVDNEAFITRQDATWRDRDCQSDIGIIYSAWENHMDGHAYWRGDVSDNPRPELLIPLTRCIVTVIEPVARYII